jgi:hypothetical protein
MASKALVLDANILIRAVLGQRVRRILESHAESVSFFLPETAYLEDMGLRPPKVMRRLKNHRSLTGL